MIIFNYTCIVRCDQRTTHLCSVAEYTSSILQGPHVTGLVDEAMRALKARGWIIKDNEQVCPACAECMKPNKKI